MTSHSNEAVALIKQAIDKLYADLDDITRDAHGRPTKEEDFQKSVRFQRAIWKMEFAMDNILGISKD